MILFRGSAVVAINARRARPGLGRNPSTAPNRFPGPARREQSCPGLWVLERHDATVRLQTVLCVQLDRKEPVIPEQGFGEKPVLDENVGMPPSVVQRIDLDGPLPLILVTDAEDQGAAELEADEDLRKARLVMMAPSPSSPFQISVPARKYIWRILSWLSRRTDRYGPRMQFDRLR